VEHLLSERSVAGEAFAVGFLLGGHGGADG
jgi:hypothetical protein